MKVSVAELEEAKQSMERMEKRLNKHEKLLSKDRAKLQKLKRSLGITSKIQGRQMVSEAAGSKSGSARLVKEEGSQKTKVVRRLSPEANGIVMGRCIPPHPRIPSWKLAMESEYTQELYKKSLALSEKLAKQHQDMYEQVFRKGYIKMEVADNDNNSAGLLKEEGSSARLLNIAQHMRSHPIEKFTKRA